MNDRLCNANQEDWSKRRRRHPEIKVRLLWASWVRQTLPFTLRSLDGIAWQSTFVLIFGFDVLSSRRRSLFASKVLTSKLRLLRPKLPNLCVSLRRQLCTFWFVFLSVVMMMVIHFAAHKTRTTQQARNFQSSVAWVAWTPQDPLSFTSWAKSLSLRLFVLQQQEGYTAYSKNGVARTKSKHEVLLDQKYWEDTEKERMNSERE